MTAFRSFWYSVDGDTRWELPTHSYVGMRHLPEYVIRDFAVDAAEDYHSNHDGWEASWPLRIELYETEEGPLVASAEVERETVPQFHAWDVAMSEDAVDPVAANQHEPTTRAS